MLKDSSGLDRLDNGSELSGTRAIRQGARLPQCVHCTLRGMHKAGCLFEPTTILWKAYPNGVEPDVERGTEDEAAQKKTALHMPQLPGSAPIAIPRRRSSLPF